MKEEVRILYPSKTMKTIMKSKHNGRRKYEIMVRKSVRVGVKETREIGRNQRTGNE